MNKIMIIKEVMEVIMVMKTEMVAKGEPRKKKKKKKSLQKMIYIKKEKNVRQLEGRLNT